MLNFVEKLPDDFLEILLLRSSGFLYPSYILSNLISNLVRIYSFFLVEKKIKRLSEKTSIYLDKLFILFLLENNRIDHQYDFDNHRIEVLGISENTWEGNYFKKRIRNLKSEHQDRKLLSAKLSNSMKQRYEFIYQELDSNNYPEIAEQLRKMCPAELLDRYDKINGK